ncbi:hypothetical protein JTE88_01145 [Arcanobacterium phocisimile]|uniref:Uncharacterized protein n=1 Tax=Arcanobacterium phocisimile TaxID=1302235 RepID=A0ABX7IHS5_9ACTO|nr:hypothetical protein [Arcanobacterium phocisimile]QRV02395.1 hypothetical protein JTE88_01145 [Arcanobacterium phocisimile]
MSTSASSTTSFFVHRLPVFLVVFLMIVAVAGFGIWRWGQNLNYWGTPKELSALLAEDVASPTSFGLEPTEYWQTPPAGFLGKSRPYEVRYIVEDTDGKALVTLQKAALADGWMVDSSCPDSLLWCANKRNSDSPTKRLTISPGEDISTIENRFPIVVSLTYY